MSYASRFARLARKYGQPLSVYDREGTLLREGQGFLQPVTSEGKDYLWQEAGELGTYDGGRFRLLGEAALLTETEQPDSLICLEQRYRVRTVQPVRIGTEIVYWWGIVTPLGEECEEA